jgi:hypothetical protein
LVLLLYLRLLELQLVPLALVPVLLELVPVLPLLELELVLLL